MEYIEGGELKECIATKLTPFTEPQAKKIMKILIASIEYIHKKNIVHLDLKLENILVKDINDHSSMKIIDFGISGLLSKVGGELVKAGTLMYCPPEILSHKRM
jgi:serine/threonine protein kinase